MPTFVDWRLAEVTGSRFAGETRNRTGVVPDA
jgi:hypothetical protein